MQARIQTYELTLHGLEQVAALLVDVRSGVVHAAEIRWSEKAARTDLMRAATVQGIQVVD